MIKKLETENHEASATSKTKKTAAPASVKLVIPELAVKIIEVKIRGITPLVMRAWDEKTEQMLADIAQGKKSARSRENVVPEQAYNAARYISAGGWDGVPAGAFKAALVDSVSCGDIPRTQFSMTLAKKTFFVHADGIDIKSGRALVKIYGTPAMLKQMQRTTTGAPYMSYRPVYRQWSAVLRIEYNAARIDAQGVLNLVAWAGHWVGVGEHRPSAPESKTGDGGRWEIMAPDDKMPDEGSKRAKKAQ